MATKVKARNKKGAAASGKAKGKAAAKKGSKAASRAQINAEFDKAGKRTPSYHPPKKKKKKRNTGSKLAKDLKGVLFGGSSTYTRKKKK